MACVNNTGLGLQVPLHPLAVWQSTLSHAGITYKHKVYGSRVDCQSIEKLWQSWQPRRSPTRPLLCHQTWSTDALAIPAFPRAFAHKAVLPLPGLHAETPFAVRCVIAPACRGPR